MPPTSIALAVGAGDEVALLVEDGVVGEPVLAVDRLHGAVGEHGERVVGVPVVAAALDRLGEADQGRDPGRQPAASCSTARTLAARKWRFRYRSSAG